MDYTRVIECPVCHKLFNSNDSRAKYCNVKCKQKVINDSARLRRLEKKENKKKKDNMLSIIEIDREAKAKKMSYGKYMNYLQENKNAKI